MNSPQISVIIPSYNHAIYLPDAINSVLHQTCRDLEIIVVDDGSTDSTCQVAAAFGDEIRYVYQENQGLSAARNTGLALARGKYVTVLDADDLLEPTYVHMMLTLLEADTNAAAAYCGFQMVDSENRALFQNGLRGAPPKQLYEKLLFGNFIVPPCMLVRREVYDRIGGFDLVLGACADWDMWLRVAYHFTALPAAAILVRYRVLSGSMSTSPDLMLNDRLAVLEKQNSQVSNANRQRAIGYAYRIAAIEWLQAGDEEQAMYCFRQAAERYPALLGELETFYELAFWDQPKGWRGDVQQINVTAHAEKILSFLQQLFAMPGHSAELITYRDVSSALAYKALGLISYGRREMRAARRYFRASVAVSPRQIVDRNFIKVMAKSVLYRPV